MSINEIQNEITEEFSAFDDWMDRYSLLIDLGNDLPAFPDELRTPQNIIDGCQSTVWIDSQYDRSTGIITYRGDADAILVKGMVALLIRVLSGHSAKEIAEADLYFIEQIGLRDHLSPTRSNGLLAMVRQMKMFAKACVAASEV